MKRQIRRGVYETNSSSCHSLVMCMESDYDRWENEGLYLFKGSSYGYPDDKKPTSGNFYTRDEAIAFEKASKYSHDYVDWNNDDDVEDMLHDNEWYDFDYFWNNYCEDYETFTDYFTTPTGESVCSFGYYGYN